MVISIKKGEKIYYHIGGGDLGHSMILCFQPSINLCSFIYQNDETKLKNIIKETFE
jgi:hypothetical protein